MAVDVDKKRNEEERIQARLNELLEPESSQSLKRAMSFVVEKSLPIPKHWGPEKLEELEFPSDLTNLTMAQLGKLMGHWTEVIAYINFEVAKADIEQSAAKNQLDFQRKKYYLELGADPEKSYTEKEKEARIVADEEMARLLLRFEYAKARFTLLRALAGSYQKYYTALSRELSRRGVAGPEPSDDDYDDGLDVEPDLRPTPEIFKGNEAG